METKGKKAVFLGDSITEGVGTSDISKGFVNLLKEKLELSEAYNRGIAGTRFAIQSAPSEEPSFDKDFISRVAELPQDADLVVVFGGTNDYGHGDAPFGDFSDRTGYTFCGACHVLFESLINKYYDKKIVVMTPLHREFEHENGKFLGDYVDMIRKVCEHYSLPVLDMYATSGIQPQLEVIRNAFCPDGLHPNDAGNEIIAEKLSKFIQNL